MFISINNGFVYFESKGEYIRFGCDSALIEIELYNEKPNEKNFLIQRHINSTRNKNGKVDHNSSYKLNGKESNRALVREFVKSLNINVDNLCQFLPQERVIEFVKMDQKTLLECTEKAAGDIHMFDLHKQIVDLSKDIKKLNETNIDLNNLITTETELQVRAEEELRRIEEKDKFKEEIKWLKKRRPWIEYEDKRLEHVAAKEEFLKKKQELEQISRSLDPLRAEVKELHREALKHDADKKKAFEEVKNAAKFIEPTKTRLEQCLGKMTDAKTRYFEKLSQENKRKNDLKQLENELALLKDEYDNEREDINVEEQIRAVIKSLNENNTKSSQINKNKMQLKSDFESLVIEKNKLESTKKKIGDVFNRRLDKLAELNFNARKAYEWLTHNENKFNGKIYPPIMTQINMKRTEWAKYVESAVSKNDLMAFICEDREDLKLFTELINKELNIRVNVVMAPNENENDFSPEVDIEGFSQYGLYSYVKDMFTAPNKVMAYLCKTSRLHCIPVGNNRTDDKIESLINSTQFRRIYTEKNVYNITVSRYDNEKVIRSDNFPEAKFLNLVIDENLLNETKRKIVEKEDSINKVKSELQEIDQILTELSRKSEELMKDKKLLDAKKNARKILETKISSKKEQITRNQNSAIDLNDAKTTVNVELKILEESQMSLLSKLNTNIAECIKKNDDKLKIVLSEMLVKRRLQYSSKKLSNSEVEYQDIKNEVLRLQNSLNDLKNEAKILRNKAKAESGFDVNTDLSEEIRVKFDAMPNSVEEIDNKIGTLRLRMESILDADESVRDSYNKRRRDIERRQKDLKMRQIELKEKETKLEDIKNRWLPSLEELIAKINSNFGRFMARLNCAGEVSLYRGNDVITNLFNFNEFYFQFSYFFHFF